MSLKSVHLVFVTVLSALAFGSGFWLLKRYAAAPGEKTDLVLGCLALTAGVAVVIYGKYFLKKLKNVSYL